MDEVLIDSSFENQAWDFHVENTAMLFLHGRFPNSLIGTIGRPEKRENKNFQIAPGTVRSIDLFRTRTPKCISSV